MKPAVAAEARATPAPGEVVYGKARSRGWPVQFSERKTPPLDLRKKEGEVDAEGPRAAGEVLFSTDTTKSKHTGGGELVSPRLRS